MKITKTELRTIIKEELQRLNEETLQNGDYVMYYELENGKKYPWYIIYMDSTHVALSNTKPKPGERFSGMGVYHIGQLKHRDYYKDMVTWMKTGNKKHIDGKTYKSARG